MRHLLARPQRALVEQFARSRLLLAFDFDGTLAPIVREPEAARMRSATRALLARAAASYPCVVISGRGRADVAKRLDGVPLREIVGNHGLEPSRREGEFSRKARAWAQHLERRLVDAAGVEVELKGPSIAVHYRKARARRASKAQIDLALRSLPGAFRIIPGKLVVNVLPEGAPHKGIALQRLRTKLRADTALYVGDDATDEDVFVLDEPGRLLSVRVGRSERTAALYYLRSQAEIDDLLRLLCELRR